LGAVNDSEERAAQPGEDPLLRAWSELEAAWDDEAAHERALVIADTLDRLGALGALYRAVREEGGERAEVAAQYQKAILARALGRLRPTPPTPTRNPIEWILMGVSVALVAAALWSVLRTF
jgi:hypothetical protein